MHHVSIRTADIHRAMAFYEQLGFMVQERFTTGGTLACWMEGLGGRLELIQVPEPRGCGDAFHDEHFTGFYHLSFDLTPQAIDLTTWLRSLQLKFEHSNFNSIYQRGFPTVLLTPRQQMIGGHIYEVAFIADADGLPIEFIRLWGKLEN
ncbi:MAG: VOC family protein [Cyanobacteria bacterium WB6_1B_304]|nr:VOC family protein [Cyanobacteria bacterium WB6_1B_304]